MTDTVSEIKSALQNLAPSYIDIRDDSALHAGHAGNTGGGHYTVTIISEQFRDKSLLSRHRMVNDAVKALFGERIHALSIKAKTPSEQ